ncbi:hypothetical protein [Enterococcus faecalis]|uniref:hypothetical protein n=1 Tax=Enterococcus faecalis TaxID=1351 RepID=UPI001A96BECB|nr:hypothetical protein [Enterococcus faecalis]MBO1136617.1 hypothetical protein [Enterococcus faecalis]
MEIFKQKIIKFCTENKIFELAKNCSSKKHDYTEKEILALSDWNHIKNYLCDLNSDLFAIFRSKYGRMRHKDDDGLNAIVSPINYELSSLIDYAINLTVDNYEELS